jgi:hypothetical protein
MNINCIASIDSIHLIDSSTLVTLVTLLVYYVHVEVAIKNAVQRICADSNFYG